MKTVTSPLPAAAGRCRLTAVHRVALLTARSDRRRRRRDRPFGQDEDSSRGLQPLRANYLTGLRQADQDAVTDVSRNTLPRRKSRRPSTRASNLSTVRPDVEDLGQTKGCSRPDAETPRDRGPADHSRDGGPAQSPSRDLAATAEQPSPYIEQVRQPSDVHDGFLLAPWSGGGLRGRTGNGEGPDLWSGPSVVAGTGFEPVTSGRDRRA